jgi:hypothetical protein
MYAKSTPASLGCAGLEISSSNLTFHISLVHIDTLKPHEEVVESLVESLADAIKSQSIVRDPLIVDEKQHVILDGMHRYRAMEHLGCRFAPCCLVDYDNPLIEVSSWFRQFTVDATDSLAETLLRENKLSCSKGKIDIAGLSSASGYIILTAKGIAYPYARDLDTLERAKAAVALEKTLTMRGHPADYLSEDAALQNLRSGSACFIIGVPAFNKQQIREFAVKRLLLPHKTTRHVMPSRPLRIDIPLEILRNESLSQTQADALLQELLSTKRAERRPPGSIVDGRHYDEELLVFSG